MIESSGRRTWIEDFEYHVSNLSDVFPEARVAVCFRRHDELVESLYRQYLKEGGTGEIEALFDKSYKDNGLVKHKDLKFFDRIEILSSKFELPPYVFKYQDISNDFKSCISNMLNSLGVSDYGLEDVANEERNSGSSTYKYRILRFLNEMKCKNKTTKKVVDNKFTRKMGIYPANKILNFDLPFQGEDHEIDHSLKREIREMYKGDWERVEDYVENQNPSIPHD
jgi:hypothetical protein